MELQGPGLGCDAGIIQEIHDQSLNTFHALQGTTDVAIRFGIEGGPVLPSEDAEEPPDGDKRFLQVMGRDGGELFQLAIAPLQLRREDSQSLFRRMPFFV